MIDQGRKPMEIVAIPCGQFVEPLKAALGAQALVVVQSFDLQSTRAAHEGCTCPHHGTSQCSCELVVLLVYGAQGDPLSLVLDGRDGQTYVFIPNEVDGSLRVIEQIRLALGEVTARLAPPKIGDSARVF